MRSVPSYISVADDSTPGGYDAFKTFFAAENPGYQFSREAVTEHQALSHDTGTAWTWVREGEFEVTMEGRWTQEDGIVREGTSPVTKLGPGDVVVTGPSAKAECRGNGILWQITCEQTVCAYPDGVRRLGELPDTAGGCNPLENAFRRLQLVWSDTNVSASKPDGENLLGCHVVWISEPGSRAHYHPTDGRGFPQHEMYLVLRPEDFGLRTAASEPGLWTYPKPGDWSRFDFTPLHPGDVVSIPAGVVHRAVDILACVVAIPGFKPDNELYVDALIARETEGRSPHNPRFVEA